jgi:uncharacterized protein YbjT (DUF2867 family)
MRSVLITGAAGKTGRAIIRALAAQGAQVRAYVHREAQVPALSELDAASVSVGDLGDAATLTRAAEGVAAIYHLAPNMSPDEQLFGRAALAAARGSGARLVYHSVLHPQVEAMPHHWEKARVEEMLFASGVAVTVLQPTVYMQNLLPSWRSIALDGVHRTPYSVDARISLVDLADVAQVAATVLTEPGHEGATYELVGTSPLSQIEVAETLATVLGRPVRVEAESTAEWSARATGLSDYARDTLIKMFAYYDQYGLVGNPTVLRHLLGRETRTLAQFATAVIT